MMLNINRTFAQERALNCCAVAGSKPHIHGLRADRKRKTGLAAFITAGHISRGKRVLFVAPYTILINQTAQRFVNTGCRKMRLVLSGVITRTTILIADSDCER
jgi:hypothetical protein